MKRFLFIGLPIILILYFLLAFVSGRQFLLEFMGTLLFGWVRFLMLVIREMHFDVSGTVTFGICLVLLGVGLHRLCAWLYRHKQKASTEETESPPRRWRLRWTLAMLGVILLMFVAGLSAVGLTHQTTWLATSPEPLVGPAEHWTGMTKAEATNNLRMVAISIHGFNDTNKTLPPGASVDKDGNALHSWMTLILPYGFRSSGGIDMDLPWNHPKNSPIFKNVQSIYWYPGSDITRNADGYAVSHYASNVHVIGGNKRMKLDDITDGTENTLMVGQVIDQLKPWGQPGNWRDPANGINISPQGFGNPIRTGALFLTADGHVKFLTNDTSPEVLKALSTPNSGD